MSYLGKEVNRLLKGIKQGNNSLRNELYIVTINFLRVVAWGYAFNKDDIEDILMETFLRVFKSISTFDSKKDGYNWMCKILQNVAYDYNRRNGETVEFEEEFYSFENFEFDELLDKDQVGRAILKLSRDEQHLIYLYFYKCLTFRQIAHKIGGKKSTIHHNVKQILEEIEKNL